METISLTWGMIYPGIPIATGVPVFATVVSILLILLELENLNPLVIDWPFASTTDVPGFQGLVPFHSF